MDEILAAAARLNDWALELTVFDFEEERGRLGAVDRARAQQLQRDFDDLHAQAEDRWRALPLPQIVAYDKRVTAALDRLGAAGGHLGALYRETLEPRALATCSPERAFDFWAIWAVHRVLRQPS